MIKSLLTGGAVALGLMVGAAQAATVTVSGTGEITTVGSAFASQFVLGGQTSFELVYDSDAAAIVGVSDFARYAFLSATMTFATSTGGTQSLSADPSALFYLQRLDLTSLGFGIDEDFGIQDATVQDFAGVSGSRFQINLRGVGDLLTDVSLPTALDVGDLDPFSNFRVVDRSGFDVNLTSNIQTLNVSVDDPSVVPLPAGGLLLISGLGLLAVQRRRLKAQAA